MTKRYLIPAGLVVTLAAAALVVFGPWKGRAETAPPRVVPMSMRGYAFNGQNPTLAFEPGERVRFVVSNDEDTQVLHNFRIAGMNVPCGPALVPGEQREITVTMPRSGEFAYTCCTHPGMGGKMVVARR